MKMRSQMAIPKLSKNIITSFLNKQSDSFGQYYLESVCFTVNLILRDC
jgi:hypothetical protein